MVRSPRACAAIGASVLGAACFSGHPAPTEPSRASSIEAEDASIPTSPGSAKTISSAPAPVTPPPTTLEPPSPAEPDPVATPAGEAPKVQAIAVGEHLSCALIDGGEVRCWGATRLTAIPATPRPTPIGIDDATSVSVGDRHACAARTDGSVVCWGDNRDGQIGDGTTDPAGTLTTVAGLSKIVEVVAGGHHTCARDRDGAVFCWGHDGCTGRPRGRSPRRPGRVAMPAATGLVVGDDITCALMDGGAPRCWGFNTTGLLQPELGPVDHAKVTAPLEKATTFALGFRHVCATFDGYVYCAGDDPHGQLGDQDVPDDAQCDPYAADGVSCRWTERPPPSPPPDERMPRPYPPAPRPSTTETREYPRKNWFVHARGVRATALAAADGRSCAITPERAVMCWGQWYHGLDWSYRRPSRVDGVADAVAIAVAQEHACALRADGSVWCWGFNRSGELGNGEIVPHIAASPASPVRW